MNKKMKGTNLGSEFNSDSNFHTAPLTKFTNFSYNLANPVPNTNMEINNTEKYINHEKESKDNYNNQFAIEEPLRDCNEEFKRKIKRMAVSYSFELDNFQKQAILHIENNECVFLSAHTSAGKTVVAEYAIALSIKNLRKAVYTSPIKALSNQKFREFKKTFGDVGIITGDVSINPNASCLILTTEIFRSILYKGNEIINEMEWIIFDEVHYVNDEERGVVWEEIIIMLPKHINIILLSATVPNALEFANWVGKTKNKKIYVISTLKRPVALKHQIWRNNRLYTIMEDRTFIEKTFTEMRDEEITQREKERELDLTYNGNYKSKLYKWFDIVHYLRANNLLPVVIFVFSRKLCDSLASNLSNLQLTNSDEENKISIIIMQSLLRLNDGDKHLSQISKISLLLRNGIGIHHAGLLPIVKELVEMCFTRGLVKVLFATETFAMGINMPAKTVIFENVFKHDGKKFRQILPGEYTQMSGRAGRRGIDKIGTVITISNSEEDIADKHTIKHLIQGEPRKLISKFRLTYNMILNLLKNENLCIEEVIKNSFLEFDSEMLRPKRKEYLNKQKLELEIYKQELKCPNHCNASSIEDLYKIMQSIKLVEQEIFKYAQKSPRANKIFTVGRLLLISHPTSPIKGICVLLSVQNAILNVDNYERSMKKEYLGLVICPEEWKCDEDCLEKLREISKKNKVKYYSYGKKEQKTYFINRIEVSDISAVCLCKIRIPNPKEIYVMKDGDKISGLISTVKSLQNKYHNKIPNMDFIKHMQLNDIEMFDKIDFWRSLIEIRNSSEVYKCSSFETHYTEAIKYVKLKDELLALSQMASGEDINLMKTQSKMMKVLKEMKFVNEDNTVLVKGRVACEINTCDSLILTEAIFENFLFKQEPEDIVSIISCLVYESICEEPPIITAFQEESLNKLISIAKNLGEIQYKNGLNILPEEYVESNVHHGLMQVVYEWAKGKDFREICRLTSIQEGIIVRCIVRIDETCRDIKKAAKAMGNPDLYRKMETASSLIKRGIVFTASLYLV